MNAGAGMHASAFGRNRTARPVILSRDDAVAGVLRAWASQFIRRSGEADPRHLLVAMARFIRNTMQRHAGAGSAAQNQTQNQTPLTTLTLQSGTDVDFSILMLGAIQALDYPVRATATERPGVQIFVPGQGWIDFDPSTA
jgi:transglutaminase-like putative cysteine protease